MQGKSPDNSGKQEAHRALSVIFHVSPILPRQVHLYRSSFPPGAADGLLLDSDVHSQPPYCHSVLDFLLDQYGCCTCSCWPGDHHSAHYDHAELWFPSITAQGGEHTYLCRRAKCPFHGDSTQISTQILLLNPRDI